MKTIVLCVLFTGFYFPVLSETQPEIIVESVENAFSVQNDIPDELVQIQRKGRLQVKQLMSELLHCKNNAARFEIQKKNR